MRYAREANGNSEHFAHQLVRLVDLENEQRPAHPELPRIVVVATTHGYMQNDDDSM